MVRRLLALAVTTAGLVAATLGDGGTAHAARDHVSYYRISRPDFYLDIEVRHRAIVKTRLRANYSCVGSFKSVRGYGLNLDGREEEIPLTRTGHFKHERKNEYERLDFTGRVTGHRATGFFRYAKHNPAEPECGSGSTNRRTIRFSARRAAGFPRAPKP